MNGVKRAIIPVGIVATVLIVLALAVGTYSISQERRAAENAWKVYESGNYALAFENYQTLAGDGYTWAQFRLGWMYEHGQGTSIDLNLAAFWYESASVAGDAEAQYYFSVFNNGSGRFYPQDIGKVVYWMTMSAGQGYQPAQATLSNMYLLGDNVPRLPYIAYFWALLAQTERSETAKEIRPIKRFEETLSVADSSRAISQAKICLETNYRNCSP